MKYFLVIQYDENGIYKRKYVEKNKMGIEPGPNQKVHKISQPEYLSMKHIFKKNEG